MNEQLKIIISAEVAKLKQGVADAKGEIEKLQGSSKLTSEEIDNNFKAAGASIKSAATTIGTAVAAAGAALLALGASTTEYRQNQAQLNAAFEQAGFSANSAKGAYAELYKTIGDDDQAVESAANIAMLANSEKEAAQWAELASGILGTFHDTLQPEAFYEAANETLKLNEATSAFTQMLEQTGVMSVDEFNKKLGECNTEAEKQAFMLEVSKKAMGDAGAAYDKSTANIQKQREAQLKLQSSLATLGEALSPVLTAFTEFGAEALAVVVPHLKDLAEKYLPTLKTILNEVADALKVAFEWASEHKTLLTTIGAIILTIVAAIGLYNAVAAVKAAMAALEVTSVFALVGAYTAQAAAMLVAIAPYVLIVAAIAAVIAIIVLCVKHWDKIKAKALEVWKKIQDATEKAVKAIKKKFDDMKTAIENKIDALKTTATNKFNAVKDAIANKIEAAKTAVANKFDAIRNGIANKVDAVKNKVTNVFNAVKTAITNPVETARETVKNTVDKIKKLFDFKWKLPKPSLPKFSVSGGKAPWGFGGKGTLPKISVSWHALGGVFDAPTLFDYNGGLHGLGENGAEAIVPLEKNTQWLDKIADKLAARQGNTPIVLQVDGKTFAETSISTINALTRQKGSLGLNIV